MTPAELEASVAFITSQIVTARMNLAATKAHGLASLAKDAAEARFFDARKALRDLEDRRTQIEENLATLVAKGESK